MSSKEKTMPKGPSVRLYSASQRTIQLSEVEMAPFLTQVLKIDSLISMMARDQAFLQSVRNDPRQAFYGRGIDLSDDELQLVRDVLEGTSNSPLARPPAEPKDLLDNWRSRIGVKAGP